MNLKGVFVIGRQHSGNTFLAKVIGQSPDFFLDQDENSWFERVSELQKINDPEARAIFSTQHLLRGKPEVAQQYLPQIIDWSKSNPDASVYELFLQSMEFIRIGHQRKYWVLKATSYIFYADQILRHTQDVKLVYIMRNPLDLTASTKKRTLGDLDWLIATNLAWRKGVEIAQKLEHAYPERFKIFKYESLVSAQQGFGEVFYFLNVPYSEDFKEIPIVNTSDNPYAEGIKKGVTDSRTYYFSKVLTKGEIYFALLLAGSQKKVQYYYPNLKLEQSISFSEKLAGFKMLFRMSWLFIKKHFNLFSPHQWNRLLVRLSILFRR